MSFDFSSHAIDREGTDHIPNEQIKDQKNAIEFGANFASLTRSPSQIKLERETHRKRI
jgi:hypothetical protein